MYIVIVQKDILNFDYLASLRTAASESADLVCLGELATSGCLYQIGRFPDFVAVRQSLKAFDCGVLIGLPRRDGSSLRNSYLYSYGDSCQIYDKQNLFTPMNEDKIYQAGTRPGIFDTAHGRLGIAICYDLRFDAVFAALKEAQPAIIFVPAAWPSVRIADWRELLVRRAFETGINIVGINAVGDDGVNRFGGCSMVVSSDGTILAEADRCSETIIRVEL
jgi:predicted amidohydrolase